MVLLFSYKYSTSFSTRYSLYWCDKVAHTFSRGIILLIILTKATLQGQKNTGKYSTVSKSFNNMPQGFGESGEFKAPFDVGESGRRQEPAGMFYIYPVFYRLYPTI